MGSLNVNLIGSGTIGDVLPGWSVSEAATPVSIADEGRTTGAATISAIKTGTSKFIVENAATLGHDALGFIPGYVEDTGEIRGAVSFSFTPILSLLTAERNAGPTSAQPLSQIFAAYVVLATDQIIVDYQASTDPVKTYQGWSGSVWKYLKYLCAANALEIVMQSGVMIVRDAGGTTLEVTDLNVTNISRSARYASQFIRVCYYNPILIPIAGAFRYNFSQNPSVENNATDWSGLVSGLTVSSGRVASFPALGTYSFRSVVTTGVPLGTTPATHSVRHRVSLAGVPDGTLLSMSISAWIVIAAGLAADDIIDGNNAYFYASAVFSNGSGKSMGGSSFWGAPRPASGTVGERREYSFNSVEKPAGAQYVDLMVSQGRGPRLLSDGSMSSIRVGDGIYADTALVTNGLLVPFFQGGMGSATWIGTPGSSISEEAVTGVRNIYSAYDDDNTIYTVEAGQVKTFEIETGGFPTSIVTPIQLDSAPGPESVGTVFVSGADNLPVTAAAWIAYGGLISLALGERPDTLTLILTGPSIEIPGVPGPYSLSASDGENEYATLNISGTGLLVFPEYVRLATGADPLRVTNEDGPDVNNPFINTIEEAYDRGLWAGDVAGGPVIILTGSIATAKIAAFGLNEGSLFTYDECQYRIITLAIGRTDTQVTAQRHVLIDDFDDLWTGETLDTIDTAWSGFSLTDIDIAPLRRI